MESIELLGSNYLGDNRCCFCVWAPKVQRVNVHILAPQEHSQSMERDIGGYYHATLDDVSPGSLYMYKLDDRVEHPDPASHFQPQGVYGPSQVIDHRFNWTDKHWEGLPFEDYIIYELHIGTFSPEGTFTSIITYLDYLVSLGITAIELMPIAQFPGERNWGYDGVFPFAVQNSYGRPHDLKNLINVCHEKGLAVVLDVVYNHFGPEGNYAGEFGYYYANYYKTPWGSAMNMDGPNSDGVRNFFIQNAFFWITEYHIDALRLDAIHAIVDMSPYPFVAELACNVHQKANKLNRRLFVIAESDRNDARLIHPKNMGGYNLDAVWNDDFHHALHTVMTGEHDSYYQDYGNITHLGKSWRNGFTYTGNYSAFRQRRYGSPSGDIPSTKFVVFAQNHDQVGNRMRGDRLSQLVGFDELKLTAGAVLLSPFTPLLFMGEEYGETSPFLYFISHQSPELVEATRKGRREEFAAFAWSDEPPDPQNEVNFSCCKLNHTLYRQGEHETLFRFYQELIRLRKELPALHSSTRDNVQVIVYEKKQTMVISSETAKQSILILFNFALQQVILPLPVASGRWHKLLDSSETRWRGNGSCTAEQLDLLAEDTICVNSKSLVMFSKEQNNG